MDILLKALIVFLLIYLSIKFFINRKNKKDNLQEFKKSSLHVIFLIVFVPLILFWLLPYTFYLIESLGESSKYTIHNNDEAVSYYSKAVAENNINICNELNPGFEMQVAGNTKKNYRDDCIENFSKNKDDIESCFKIPDDEGYSFDKVMCIMSFAKNNGDTTKCEYIRDSRINIQGKNESYINICKGDIK